MTDALLKGLKSIYAASGTLTTALPGGYAMAPATEGTPLKTLLAQVISAPSKQVYAADQDSDIRVRFTVYAAAGGAIALIESVASVYASPPDLSADGIDCSCVNQASDVIPFSVGQKDEGGNEIWGASIDLIFSVHKA